MTVHADRSALFNPVVDNRLPLGKYSCVIDSVRYTALTDLLNYIDFEKLQDRCNQPWTDDQTGTFIITYDYGKVKRIEDYAMQDIFGLRKLHEMMLALCDNQNWK